MIFATQNNAVKANYLWFIAVKRVRAFFFILLLSLYSGRHRSSCFTIPRFFLQRVEALAVFIWFRFVSTQSECFTSLILSLFNLFVSFFLALVLVLCFSSWIYCCCCPEPFVQTILFVSCFNNVFFLFRFSFACFARHILILSTQREFPK